MKTTTLLLAAFMAGCAHTPTPGEVQQHATDLRLRLNSASRALDASSDEVRLAAIYLERAGYDTSAIEKALAGAILAIDTAQDAVTQYHRLGEGYEYAMLATQAAVRAVRWVGEVMEDLPKEVRDVMEGRDQSNRGDGRTAEGSHQPPGEAAATEAAAEAPEPDEGAGAAEVVEAPEVD